MSAEHHQEHHESAHEKPYDISWTKALGIGVVAGAVMSTIRFAVRHCLGIPF